MSRLHFSGWLYGTLLLLVPLGWWWVRRRRLRLPYPLGAEARAAGGKLSRLWGVWGLGWRSLALLLLVVAMLRPSLRVTKVQTEREGLAIMLALDVSSSMRAEDFQPKNRLEVARDAVTRFVEGRESDWIGLIAFAGEALTQVPGTLEHGLVLQAIQRLEIGELIDGTAIGLALATAENRLQDVDAASKVIVLLTDGDNNRGEIDPLTAAAAARRLGIKVYTIGVGKEGLARVPIRRTPYGYEYAVRPVTINDELLTKIADATGGQYFRADDAETLERIYERIDQLEPSPLHQTRTEERLALQPELLLGALGALLLELVGGLTRARRGLAA